MALEHQVSEKGGGSLGRQGQREKGTGHIDRHDEAASDEETRERREKHEVEEGLENGLL
jgi:hypothetical protein